MKSRASSPHTSPRILKRYLVESSYASTGTPFPNATMRFSALLPPLARSRRHRSGREEANHSFLNANADDQLSSPASSTTPRQKSLSVVELPGLVEMSSLSPFSVAPTAPSLSAPARKVSGGLAPSATPPRSDSLGVAGPSPSPAATSPLSADRENSPSPWSTAVGHATTTGKSGRVIERLMNENDKLKRDLNEQVIRCQELEKNLQTYRPQIEALRQENDNLTHARDVDSNLISRRDRKIEELKAELAVQKQRREAAESLSRQREREKEEAEEQARRDIQSMTESTKHATVHAEIMETSHRQLAAQYRARAEAWQKDLTTINDQRDQDRKKLSRLDIVSDQMRQELERSRKLHAEIVEAWERLRSEQDARLQGIEDANDREQQRSKDLSAEMEHVVNQMKWLMGVKKNRDEDANAAHTS